MRTPYHAAWLLALAAGNGCGAPDSGESARRGEIRFADVSTRAGLDLIQVGGGPAADHIVESLGCGGAWLDYDGDGDPDLYLAQGATPDNPRLGPPDRLLRNDGDDDGDGIPTFTDVTNQVGLGDRFWTVGVAVADYDNDGDPDIYLTNWGGPNRLYRNDGGRFTEIGAAAGVDDERWGASAAWADVDLDGDLDLYVANYIEFELGRYPARGEPGVGGGPPCNWRGVEVFCGPRGLDASHDGFFRNDGDPDGDGIPSFTEAALEVGLQTVEPRYALAAFFFDADNDGDSDLYVANDSVANSFFVNNGDGTFTEDSLISGLAFNEQGHEQAGMGVAAADYDGDGLFDLAVTNFSHDHDTLYHNDGNRIFTDVSYTAGLGGTSYVELSWGIEFADLDHDGVQDLFIAHGHVYPQVVERDTGTTYLQRNSVYRGLGSGFEEVDDRAGPGLKLRKASRSLLPADLDGDGDLDFAVTNLNDTPDLLLNDGSAGHWLHVRLQGSQSNRDGIGARVIVRTGERRLIREITRTASFAGSKLPVAHFGLGSAGVADRVEVRWPSGRSTVRQGVGVDRLLVVRESEP